MLVSLFLWLATLWQVSEDQWSNHLNSPSPGAWAFMWLEEDVEQENYDAKVAATKVKY